MECVFEKIKSYIKNNWLFLLVMGIGSLALFLQMRQVVLYADDYSLSCYGAGNIESAFNYFTYHYMHWGGGYTGPIVIMLLGAHPIVWQLVLTLMLVIMVGLTVKMVCKKHPEYKWLVATVLWSCVFVLSIWVSRETIYWLDGGMAYLFSMFQAFLLFYFVYTRLFQNVSKKYDVAVLPIVGFFAGWSSAQSGVIAILIVVAMIVWQRFFRKKPVKKLFYITAVLCLVGFLIFYFAPGNSARMGEFAEYTSLNFVQKLEYRASSVTSLLFNTSLVELTGAPIFIYLAIGLIAIVELHFAKQEKNKKVKIVRYVCSIYSLLFVFGFALSLMNIPGVSTALQYAFKYVNLLKVGEHGLIGYLGFLSYAAAFLAIAASVVSAFFIAKQQDNPLIIVALLAAYAAEYSMLMAPYSPIRTSFYTIVFAWMIIGYLIVLIKREKIEMLPIALVIFTAFSFYLGVATLICSVALSVFLPKSKFNYAAQLYLFVGIFAILAAANGAKTFIGYYRNRSINEENVTRLVEAGEVEFDETDDIPDVVYLKQPQSTVYGFTDFVGIDWVEHDTKYYFRIPQFVDLEYEEVKE